MALINYSSLPNKDRTSETGGPIFGTWLISNNTNAQSAVLQCGKAPPSCMEAYSLDHMIGTVFSAIIYF